LAQIHQHAGPWFHRVNGYDGCWAQQGLSKDPLSRPNGVARPLITKRNNQHNFLSQHLPHGKTFLPQVDQPTNQQKFSRAADATLNHTCQDCEHIL
jgi:hypothetical protein